MTADDQCIIRMSEQAIISMALNGIEAYSIKHAAEGESRLETCGALFGYEVRLPDCRILYQIEMANVDTSAERLKSSVSPNPLAMKRKANIMSKFWPHLKYIGDYHTHPYKKRADVFSVKKEKGARRGDNKGYYLSKGDRTWLKDNSSLCKKYGYKVGLVVTIAKLQRKARGSNDFTNPQLQTIEFNLDNFKVWISAYYVFESEGKLQYSKNNDKNVTIECPSIIGFLGEV
jgi:hypothetical protein